MCLVYSERRTNLFAFGSAESATIDGQGGELLGIDEMGRFAIGKGYLKFGQALQLGMDSYYRDRSSIPEHRRGPPGRPDVEGCH